MYKAKTSLEYNIFHIERGLKKLKRGLISIKECGLNKRFDKLKTENRMWYDELYPKYIKIVKELNNKDTNV